MSSDSLLARGQQPPEKTPNSVVFGQGRGAVKLQMVMT